MSIWDDNDYTDDQTEALVKATREFRKTGHPQKAQIIEMQMGEHRSFDEIELPGDVSESRARRLALRPETELDAGLADVPPRTGPGSGQGVWQEFAELVSTIDEEVIDQFTRDEIIQILVDRDIIDGEASEGLAENDASGLEILDPTEVEDANEAVLSEGEIPREPVVPGELTEASE